MPGQDLLRWAADAALAGGSIVTVDTLREPWGPWMLHLARDGDAVDVVLTPLMTCSSDSITINVGHFASSSAMAVRCPMAER
ncbi:MAG: hypothetical protein ACRD2A_08115 [Vicinamibacterales bacterium]